MAAFKQSHLAMTTLPLYTIKTVVQFLSKFHTLKLRFQLQLHLQQLLSQIFLRLQIQLQKLILLIQFNQLIRQWFQTLLRLNPLRQKRLSITNRTLPSLLTVRLQSKNKNMVTTTITPLLLRQPRFILIRVQFNLRVK